MDEHKRKSWVNEALEVERVAKEQGAEGKGMDFVEKMRILEDLDDTGVQGLPIKPVEKRSKSSGSPVSEKSKLSKELDTKYRQTSDLPKSVDFFDIDE